MEFRVSPIKIWWNFIRFFKNLIPLYRFMAGFRKESDWLTSRLCSGIELLTPETVELFSLPKAVLPLLSALYQSCFNKNSQIFLANSIVPDLFRWTLLSFKCLSMSTVSLWSIKVISRSPHMFIIRLFTSCALLFRLSFRGTISDIVTAFVSDFRGSARSMTDLDIWLAVLLLLSSFVPYMQYYVVWIKFWNGWSDMVIHTA